MDGAQGPVTVSTLREAEYFFSHGVTDLLYAVGIAPNKLDHVFDLRRRGANLAIILDNLEIAKLVAAKSVEWRDPLPALIEVDTDEHRSGIKPPDSSLIAVAARASRWWRDASRCDGACRQFLQPAEPGVVRGDG